MIALDTNVLVYAHHRPNHGRDRSGELADLDTRSNVVAGRGPERQTPTRDIDAKRPDRPVKVPPAGRDAV